VFGGNQDPVGAASPSATVQAPEYTSSPTEEPIAPSTPRQTPTEAGRTDLKLVDYGFTPDSESDGASYAVIIANPNETWVPNFVTVTITFFDSGGDVVTTTDEVLYTVLPGKAAVAGGSFDGVPARMKVKISRLDESDWEEIERGSLGHYEFSRVKTVREQYGGHRTTGLISGTFKDDQDSVEVTCVYYNSADDILGGEFTYVDQVTADDEAAFEMTSYQTFPDLSKTKCYADIGG
jgi:hypothetical protein